MNHEEMKNITITHNDKKLIQKASQVALVKNLPAGAGDARGVDSVPQLGRFPWRRKWQPTQVFLAWKIPWAVELGGQ